MVKRTGLSSAPSGKDSGFRDRAPGVRSQASSIALALLCLFICSSLVTRHSSLLFAQQPQAQQGQPLSALNAKYVNGVAPGYWPAAGTGLTLNLSAGTALCGSPPAPVTYAGGTLTMTAAATNYVYLDPLLSCAPSLNTSGFGVGQIPIAVVVANGSGITTVNDVRSWFSPPISMDSTGRSIVKGLNGAYLADQLGDKSTTGIASGISACGSSTPCRIVVPGSYPTTEQVPGSMQGGSSLVPGTTNPNVTVQDFRYGDWQTGINQTGQGANNGPWHLWTEDVYTPYTGSSASSTIFNPVMNWLDGGQNLSGSGYYAKHGAFPIFSILNKYTPGDGGNRFVSNCYSIGDCFPGFFIDNFYGGQATGGEEGALGVENYVLQGTVAYQGTCASGCTTGSTSLTLSPTAGSGTQGAGRYLLITTPAKTITAGVISAINAPGGAPAIFTGNGTSWPVSTVSTTSTQAVSAPGVQTVSLTSTSGITTSTVLVFGDASALETITPTAVSGGGITANFTAPHASGASVCSGGLSGYFVELTADTVSAATTGGTALRQAFPVLCSSSSTSMTVYVDAQGTYSVLSSGSSTAWSNTSGQNGYVLYPGAQVLSVYSAGAVGNTFTLMPNTMASASSDTFEEPQHPASHSSGGNWLTQTWWPNANAQGMHMMFEGVPGFGTQGLWIQNLAPSTLYQGGGGYLNPPNSAMSVWGAWNELLEANGYGPTIQGMVFDNQGWGAGCPSACAGTIYPISVRPGSGNGDYLSYASYVWKLTAGQGSGSYSFGPTSMSAPGHFGSSSSDAAGSVTISSSTSATVNFGTSYNSAPKCVVTPTSDPTSVGAYWVTSTTSGLTVYVHASGTITFNYVCVGI
ncbi:MAG: hypothetical protein ACLQVM_04715 [Terriglobia bacterium]